MDLLVERVDVWAESIQDKPSGLVDVLAVLRHARANLQCIIARPAPDQPGKGVLFVTPLQGGAGGLQRHPLWCAKINRSWRELGSLCDRPWHGPRTGHGRAEKGSGRGERRAGRDVEFVTIMSSAMAINSRDGRDRKLATCQRQFARRLRYARSALADASKRLDTYKERGRWSAKRHPAIMAQSGQRRISLQSGV
jgi:hypothetical protein